MSFRVPNEKHPGAVSESAHPCFMGTGRFPIRKCGFSEWKPSDRQLLHSSHIPYRRSAGKTRLFRDLSKRFILAKIKERDIFNRGNILDI